MQDKIVVNYWRIWLLSVFKLSWNFLNVGKQYHPFLAQCLLWFCLQMQQQPPTKRRKKDNLKSSHLSRLIRLKVKCDLSNKQLQHVLDLYHPGESVFLSKLLAQQFRAQKQCKSVDCYRLHGCITCDSFIWSHNEDMPCPNCGNQDGRYCNSGDPRQEVFYFPILPRLEAMYRQVEWRKTLEYPGKRPNRRDRRWRSDVFDGTAYKRLRSGVICDHFVVLSY